MSRPHQLAVRHQAGNYLLGGPDHADPHKVGSRDDKKGVCSSKLDLVYSPDGSMLAAIDADAVKIYDSASGAVKSSIPAVNCAIASFSPKGTYILTWERLTDDLQNKGGNLRVSQAATGEFVGGFVQKSFSKEAWPYVKWSSDEMIASMKITDGVHLFAGNDIAKGVIGKVPHEKMTSFGMAPGPAPYKFATFSPEKGDKPAQIKTWVYPNLKEAVGNKTMFRASDAEIKWSPNGQAGLVKTTTDVDATGKSYYGESKLAFISADGQSDGTVPLSKEGPIHDLAWSPTGKEFIVVYGFMPAKATLFDMKCKPVFDFGTGSRNTVLWAPHGRFLVLGGFGNISGNMQFWDNNRKKMMAEVKAPGSTNYAWSPCSRFFLTATLFPRLRVDNGFKVWKYDGSLVHQEQGTEEMYQVEWRPAPDTTYPDRPASPGAGQKGASQGVGADEPVKKAYVPPHMRGKEGEARKTISLHVLEDAKKVGGMASFGAVTGGKNLPPGASEEDEKLSKSALKKKKAKEKAEREAKEAEALEETQAALRAAGIDSPVAAAGASQDKVGSAGPKALETAEDVQKRIKAVSKKLKQAQTLAEEAKGGKELNVDQKGKIESIGAMQEEIKGLEEMLKKM